MHLVANVMRDHDEKDPKKPHSFSLRRKGENAPEVQEHEPHEVGPGGTRQDDRDRHLHVSC